MCGLFGYVGSRADRKTLARTIERACRRGPDGWGIWTDGGAATGGVRFVGSDRLAPGHGAELAYGARTVLGHARLATVLGTVDQLNAQPLLAGPLVLAHNGTVWNYDALASRLPLATKNDSEAFAAVILTCVLVENSLLDAVETALTIADLGEHYAFTVAYGDEVVLAAHNQALHTFTDATGTYWASGAVDPAWTPVNGTMHYRTQGVLPGPDHEPETQADREDRL